jgi:hypothetical protein
MLMVLQKAQIAFISKQVVIAGEGSFTLGVLLSLHPLSLVDMLHAIGGRFGSSWFLFILVAHLVWAACLHGL